MSVKITRVYSDSITDAISVEYTTDSVDSTFWLRILDDDTNFVNDFDPYKSGDTVFLNSRFVKGMYENYPDANDIKLRVIVYERNNGTIASQSILFKELFIDTNEPLIIPSVVDTNSKTIALTGDETKFIKGYSTALAHMDIEPQKGAAIAEDYCIIRNGEDTRYGREGEFENVEDDYFVFSAEDDRGNFGSTGIIVPMVDYIPLTNNIYLQRPDALGSVTVSCVGNYFNQSFGAVHNTLTAQYRYRVVGGSYSAWADMNVTAYEDNTYYASATFTIDNFSQNLTYEFETRVVDKLEVVLSNSDRTKSIPVFDWGEDDFAFNVPVSVGGDLDVTGNMRLKGSGNYGNKLNFGDGEYVYLAEKADDELTIHASDLVLDANVYIGDEILPPISRGVWTPELLSGAISYYTTRYGWYSKIGQCVTIGFYIKATCNAGYQNTSISILGNPFTPLYAAAGGGMCSGAYISGGFNFQCYVAETGGTITARVQQCNNTSATNLSTSASGCNYRSSGGEITLSGTISYIATT